MTTKIFVGPVQRKFKENVTMPPKWEKAINALLTEPTAKAAAEMCDVHYNTLRRWLNVPTFQKLLSYRTQQKFQTSTVSQAQTSVSLAMETLCNEMRTAGTSQDRREAAKAAGELATKMTELVAFAKRLDELEARSAIPVNQNMNDPVQTILRAMKEEEERARVALEERQIALRNEIQEELLDNPDMSDEPVPCHGEVSSMEDVLDGSANGNGKPDGDGNHA